MYWRVRKITPEQLFRQYSVHILLAISLVGNFMLFVTRPKKEMVSKEMKTDFGNFARQVTTHLLDTSYINYTDSVARLQTELSDNLKQRLRTDQILPANEQDLRANLMEFTKSRRVCALQFKQVEVKEPDGSGMVPIVVMGVVAVHSSDESAQQPFHFIYKVGLRKGDVPTPVAVDMEELLPPQVPAQPEPQ